MITAHGARLSVNHTAVEIHPAPLEAALLGSSQPIVIPLTDIDGVVFHSGDQWDESTVTLGDTTVRFAPGDTEGPEQLQAAISAAQRGETINLDAVPGFSFVALDVETANQNWGSICQIGVVTVTDGVITDQQGWLCRPPEQLSLFDDANVAIHGITAEDVAQEPSISEILPRVFEYIGDRTVVAHNAYFDASALRYAAHAAGVETPNLTFACSLAHARAVDLDVENHRLPTLASFFGVVLDNHHDAVADAAAAAGIMVGLARRAKYTGPINEFVAESGFHLGSISADHVTPVLKEFRGRPKKEKKPAPWQAVATPDTIPEPNTNADPNSPLYGHNVTLTGEFDPYDKGELWNGIAAQGGQVGKNVTKKTTILVAGAWATMTSKEKRARELMEKGQEIEIWPAEKLFSALNLESEGTK